MSDSSESSVFRLSPEFVHDFSKIEPPFGFNGLGYLVYRRSYSRKKSDGENEKWYETIERVVNGTFNIQKRWMLDNKLRWNESKAQRSAKKMYEKMFFMKFLPPGRGLWAMGSPAVEERGLFMALYSCSFVSTAEMDENPVTPFLFMMDASMLGVGVGFDTKGAGKITIRQPCNENKNTYVIDDSREGWVNSLGVLLESYFFVNKKSIEFDYSKIRPVGSPIRGFGGTAAGHGILKTCHETIRSLLDKNTGKLISERLIVDVMNIIGKCVISGNIRRSSQIAFGSPDSDEYLDLKNYEVNPERADFGWSSNNSVTARIGMGYSKIADRIRINGEPGIMWLDNMRQFSRMADPPDGKDFRVCGSNPCLTGDMLLLTSDGYKRIDELWGWNNFSTTPTGELRIITRNGLRNATGVFRTGEQVPVFRIKTISGREIRVTGNHGFPVLDNNGNEFRVDTEKLEVGDKLIINNCPSFGTEHNPDYALLAGWVIGDGSVCNYGKYQRALIRTFNNDVELLPTLRNSLLLVYNENNTSSEQKPEYKGVVKTPNGFTHEVATITSNLLGRMLFEDGVTVGNKHSVPKSIFSGNKTTVASFLSGLFSADGSVQAYGSRASVRLSQNSKELLLDCQKLLLQFGIESSVLRRRESRELLMNDGKGGKSAYLAKANYELIISRRDNLKIFYENIGFLQSEKSEKLWIWLQEHSGSNNSSRSFVDIVTSIEPDGVEDVYCLTEPMNHEIVVNGIVTYQCGEISLESFENCNVVEIFPNHCEDKDDFIETLRCAFLYAKTVTLGRLHWPEANQVMLRNRRIGCSLSGIAQFLAKHGINQFKRWCEDGYSFLKEFDKKLSGDFAVPTSIKLTTVKPSGSVSLVAGATPGVHYPESRYYIRRVRLSKYSDLLDPLKLAGYKTEPAVGDPETVVVEIPVDSGYGVRASKEVSMWEQLNLASFLQKHWTDNQVSCTVTFDPVLEGGQIESALDYFQYSLKSVSFLPRLEGGAFPQMPYESISQLEYFNMIQGLSKVNFDGAREEVEESDKYCSSDRCELKFESEKIAIKN